MPNDDATMPAGAELDREIAEKVIGCKRIYNFHPSTNASDDYRVLEHVRKTWTMERRNAVGLKFAEIQTDRNFERLEKFEGINESVAEWHPWWLEHHPGDWSRAALAVLAEEDNDG